MPTKEQVLKRLAEIEGIWCRWNQSGEGEYIHGWNPLDNPSDWAVLIEKYKPCIVPPVADGDVWRVGWMLNGSNAAHESLPWAICLAIIEANGGMGDE